MAETKQTLLRRVIASHFQALLDRYGFKEAWYECHPEHFGNEILNLRSRAFFLRFDIDKGCLGIEVCPTTDSRWTDISILLEFIGHPLDFTNVKNFDGIVSAEAASPIYAVALETHFTTIFDALAPNFEKTQIEFNAFLKERGARLFGIRE